MWSRMPAERCVRGRTSFFFFIEGTPNAKGLPGEYRAARRCSTGTGFAMKVFARRRGRRNLFVQCEEKHENLAWKALSTRRNMECNRREFRNFFRERHQG